MTQSISEPNTYRPMSSPRFPPTRFGRKYGVLSYLLLASFLELQETKPAVEAAIELAREEYKLFRSLLFDDLDKNRAVASFRNNLLEQSIYVPSVLVTAAHCDPSWNVEKRKNLRGKLIDREIVDWQARTLEFDMPGWTGFVPVVPHEEMIKIRYYQEITDEEFNDFFGK